MFEISDVLIGFSGSPCVLAVLFFSPLVSYGVMAILFPLVCLYPFFVLWMIDYKNLIFSFLNIGWSNMHVFQFVLTATGTEAEQVISTQRRRWNGAELGKLPVFYAVDTLL